MCPELLQWGPFHRRYVGPSVSGNIRVAGHQPCRLTISTLFRLHSCVIVLGSWDMRSGWVVQTSAALTAYASHIPGAPKVDSRSRLRGCFSIHCPAMQRTHSTTECWSLGRGPMYNAGPLASGVALGVARSNKRYDPCMLLHSLTVGDRLPFPSLRTIGTIPDF
jgi:hypothetical protein